MTFILFDELSNLASVLAYNLFKNLKSKLLAISLKSANTESKNSGLCIYSLMSISFKYFLLTNMLLYVINILLTHIKPVIGHKLNDCILNTISGCLTIFNIWYKKFNF